MCCRALHDVLKALRFLSAADLTDLAHRLGVPPTVKAVHHACCNDASALDTVTDHLFSRSQTPPRQIMRLPSTPPPLVRVRRADGPYSATKRRLIFD